MQLTKSFSVGALSLLVWMSGNWSGAIAQSLRSERYLSDQEIQSLQPEFERSTKFLNGISNEGLRTYLMQVNRIVNAWQKADPSISIFAQFLGTWAYLDDVSLHIYPSLRKGQVCIVEAGLGYPTAYNFGTVVGDKLISDGELGKIVITRKTTSRTRNGKEGVFLVKYQFANGRKSVLPLTFPKHLGFTDFKGIGVMDKGRFTQMGCMTSLSPMVDLNADESSRDKHPAEVTVQDFYNQYYNNRSNKSEYYVLNQNKDKFTSEFYRYLIRGLRIDDMYGGRGLHFQPFADTQSAVFSFQVGSSISNGDKAEVPVTVNTGLRYPGRPNPIKVIVIKKGNKWQIADLLYLRSESRSLMNILERINSNRDFQNVPWENDDSTPSIPSSIPVKPTDAIAKYPTNDDFNAFDNKLRGNPESLVKLRGNQAEQRRKFQNEWKARNPNAAKFLGAWYTGDRYFYVFPSTAKGGTCVVTQDANGTLDMKIGVVLNQELRYDGGKGFFWRDRPNIIASRDSGSGSLYPIYATFGMPELPENMIGDMERQKCITTLPTDPVAAKPSPQRTDGQILTSENVGCTKDLKTALGQKAPDYCTSSEANSGILLDEFKAEKNKDNSINVKLRVFNRGTADGIVEIYDSRNRLQGTKIIDGNRPPTGLIQSGTDLFTKVPSSLFSRYPLGDARRDLKEQSIDFTIPSRGYAQITKSSNFALWYNTAMIALEISQLAGGDPELVNSETVKQLVRGFAAEFAKSSVINIFKGEVSLQSIISLDFVDKNKLAEVLQKLLQYSVTIEKDPSKNPILGAFSEVYLTAGNVGLERILDMYVLPGLGTLAKGVRVGGEVVNIAAKSIDTSNAKNSGQKATIILRNLQ